MVFPQTMKIVVLFVVLLVGTKAAPLPEGPVQITLPIGPDVTTITEESSAVVDNTASASQNAPPVIDVDRARFDKDLSADKKTQYSFIQKILVNILQPKPIVDSIQEDEKYGNDGESFGKIGRGFVGGVTSLTNLLSAAVDIPFEALKNVTRKASASLNSLGNKLVGL